MGVASGCGEQEVGVASGSGWNLWVWLLGVVVRKYIDFFILLIPTPLVSVLFCSSIPTFCSFLKCFLFLLVIQIGGCLWFRIYMSNSPVIANAPVYTWIVSFKMCVYIWNTIWWSIVCPYFAYEMYN